MVTPPLLQIAEVLHAFVLQNLSKQRAPHRSLPS